MEVDVSIVGDPTFQSMKEAGVNVLLEPTIQNTMKEDVSLVPVGGSDITKQLPIDRNQPDTNRLAIECDLEELNTNVDLSFECDVSEFDEDTEIENNVSSCLYTSITSGMLSFTDNPDVSKGVLDTLGMSSFTDTSAMSKGVLEYAVITDDLKEQTSVINEDIEDGSKIFNIEMIDFMQNSEVRPRVEQCGPYTPSNDTTPTKVTRLRKRKQTKPRYLSAELLDSDSDTGTTMSKPTNDIVEYIDSNINSEEFAEGTTHKQNHFKLKEITQKPLFTKLSLSKKRRHCNRKGCENGSLSRNDIIEIINSSLSNSNVPCTSNRYRRHFLKQYHKVQTKQIETIKTDENNEETSSMSDQEDEVNSQSEECVSLEVVMEAKLYNHGEEVMDHTPPTTGDVVMEAKLYNHGEEVMEDKPHNHGEVVEKQTSPTLGELVMGNKPHMLRDVDNDGRPATQREMTGVNDRSLECKLCQKHFTSPASLTSHYICHSLLEKERTNGMASRNKDPVEFRDCFDHEDSTDEATIEDEIQIDKNDDSNHSESESLASSCVDSEQSGGKDKLSADVLESSTYFCHLCQHRFSNITALQNHVEDHALDGEPTTDTKSENYCSLCQKKFASAGSLHVHNKIHTGDNPYTCNTCSKSFRDKTRLTTHIRVHTGEKPYVCNVCQKSFSQKGNLKLHQKIHTGERNCVCGVCGNGFRSRSDLVRHMKVHGMAMSSGSENEETNHKVSTSLSMSPSITFHHESLDTQSKLHTSNKIKDLLEANITPMSTLQGVNSMTELHNLGLLDSLERHHSHNIGTTQATPYKHDTYNTAQATPYKHDTYNTTQATPYKHDTYNTTQATPYKHDTYNTEGTRSTKFSDFKSNAYLTNLNMEVEFIKAMTNAKLRSEAAAPIKSYACPMCGLSLGSFDAFNHHILLQHNPLTMFGPLSNTSMKHPSILSLLDPFMSLPKNDRYTCKECNEVFSTYEDLTVHTKTHRTKQSLHLSHTAHCDSKETKHTPYSNPKGLQHSPQFDKTQQHSPNFYSKELKHSPHFDKEQQHSPHFDSKVPQHSPHFDSKEPKHSPQFDPKGPQKGPKFDLNGPISSRDNGVGSFLLSAAMMDDMKFTSSEKLYSCEFCVKTFRRSHHLQTHMRTHTGDRPYTCVECNKCFARGDHLHNHQRTHTGEKPYQCDVCEKTYSQSHHLLRHKRTHTGERPYQCSLCEKTFSRDHHLKKHLETHRMMDLIPRQQDSPSRVHHMPRLPVVPFNMVTRSNNRIDQLMMDMRTENSASKLMESMIKRHLQEEEQRKSFKPLKTCETMYSGHSGRESHRIQGTITFSDVDDMDKGCLTQENDRTLFEPRKTPGNVYSGHSSMESNTQQEPIKIRDILNDDMEESSLREKGDMSLLKPMITHENMYNGSLRTKTDTKKETIKITDILNDEIDKRMSSQISTDLILDHVMNITRKPKTPFEFVSEGQPSETPSLFHKARQSAVCVNDCYSSHQPVTPASIPHRSERRHKSLTDNEVRNKSNRVSLKLLGSNQELQTLEDVVTKSLIEEYNL